MGAGAALRGGRAFEVVRIRFSNDRTPSRVAMGSVGSVRAVADPTCLARYFAGSSTET